MLRDPLLSRNMAVLPVPSRLIPFHSVPLLSHLLLSRASRYGVPGADAGQDDDLQDSCEEVRHEDHPGDTQGAILGVPDHVLHAPQEGHDQAHDAAGKRRVAGGNEFSVPFGVAWWVNRLTGSVTFTVVVVATVGVVADVIARGLPEWRSLP